MHPFDASTGRSDRHSARRTPAVRFVLLGLSLTALAACGSGDAPAAHEPDPVSADLMAAAESPGFGMEPRVPVTGPTPQDIDIDLAQLGYNEGDEGAPVRVLEFSDFGCGYCRQFHLESYPTLVQEYMDAGKVEWKYVPIVMGQFPNGEEAAHAGECAGEQGRFAEMRDLLFEKQPEWKRSDDPDPLMVSYAEELDLQMERFNNCVAQEWQGQRIDAGSRLFRQVGGRGTPTFFVVGYSPIPGAIPLDLFRQALDTAYVRATEEPGAQD